MHIWPNFDMFLFVDETVVVCKPRSCKLNNQLDSSYTYNLDNFNETPWFFQYFKLEVLSHDEAVRLALARLHPFK